MIGQLYKTFVCKIGDFMHKKENYNHICVVKPIGYEIEGVLETLQKLTNAERGYLIESVWKYLIYTELLKSIYTKIQQYPPHQKV